MNANGQRPHAVRIVEVGPRDGLQNEEALVSAEAKVAFVEALAGAGLPVVEVTSFVSPRAVPQLADADEVLPRVRRRDGVRYPVLVPNMRGMERAERAGADAVAVFTAASQAFVRAEHRHDDRGVARGVRARARSSRRARLVASGLRLDGVRVSLLGSRRPLGGPGCLRRPARTRVRRDLGRRHDRRRRAHRPARGLRRAAGTHARRAARPAPARHEGPGARQRGGRPRARRRVFDSSAGGTGGCPFAPGAPGNLATETLCALLDRLGIEHGVDADRVAAAAAALRAQMA